MSGPDMDLEHAGFLLTPLLVSFGLSSTVASIISGFVLAAGALLLAFLLAPKPPKPDDGKFIVQQTIPPRQFGYGSAKVSGADMLYIAPGDGGVIFRVVALVSHRVNEFVQPYLHDDQVAIVTDAGYPQTNGGAVNPEADGRYGWDDSNPRIWIDWRFGSDTETPYWFTTHPKVSPFFNSNAVGNRIASAAYEFRDSTAEKQVQRYPFGAPEPSWVLDMALVFDPRDATQDRLDPSTWKFSRNPALCIMHFECFSEFGFRRDYEKAILPLEAEWIEEADICDEEVPVYPNPGPDSTTGGVQARYELGGWGTTENDQKAILTHMLAACDGWLVELGDKTLRLRVGKFRPSGITLDQEDIEGFDLARGVPDDEVVNKLDVTFNSPSHNWSEVQTDAWEAPIDQANRGQLRQQTYALDWVQDWRRARRIAKREFTRLREPFRGGLDLRFSGLNACYERWVYVGDVSIPGLANRYIENRGARYALQEAGLKLTFVGSGSSIDDWTATVADEGLSPPLIPEALEHTELPPTPANFTASLEAFDSGVGMRKRIVCTFDTPIPYKDRDYAIRWRVADEDTVTAGDQPGDWNQETHRESPVAVSPTRLRLKTGAVIEGTLLHVSMAAVSPKGTFSDWTTPNQSVGP